MKGFSLKGENVKPEKWNPNKVSEILKTDGFWQVLYHQLATEETEEAEEKRRKVFRPRLNRNSIMELSIHNRFLLIRKLSICDSFWNQTAVLHLPGCDRGLWHLSSYSHNSLGNQYQGGTKDRIQTQKVTDIHFPGWCDLCGEHGHPLQLAPHPHDHLPHLSLWQRSVSHQHIHISLQLSWPSSGALIYRIIPPKSEGHKLKLKIGHAIIMIVAFALMVIGLQVYGNQSTEYLLTLKGN